jgi:hypothetical protein
MHETLPKQADPAAVPLPHGRLIAEHLGRLISHDGDTWRAAVGPCLRLAAVVEGAGKPLADIIARTGRLGAALRPTPVMAELAANHRRLAGLAAAINCTREG